MTGRFGSVVRHGYAAAVNGDMDPSSRCLTTISNAAVPNVAFLGGVRPARRVWSDSSGQIDSTDW